MLRDAQRLGLVAPCVFKEWPQWWQEVTLTAHRLPVIRVARALRHPFRARRILANYRPYAAAASRGDLIAHELAHVFEHHWQHKAGVLRECRRGNRFSDPWNDMLEYWTNTRTPRWTKHAT